MRKVDGDEVAVNDAVAMHAPVSGRALHDGFAADMRSLTLGLIRMRGDSIYLGPLELLRFGRADITASAVDWPIEGGILTGRPGGRFQISAGGGRLTASVSGYHPRLPAPVYTTTQLPVHHLLTRLHLLRVRGREPLPGVPAGAAGRLQAAAIDMALCAALAALTGRRHRMRILLGVAAAYHVTCWTAGGRTLGGSALHQRVVAVDGSRLSLGQSVVRLVALPLAWARNRPLHDQLAGTEVLVD